ISEGTAQATIIPSTSPVKQSRYAPILALFFLLTTLIASWIAYSNHTTVQQKLIHLSFPPPADNEVADVPVISPDGSRIAFPAADKTGKINLWVRSLNASESQEIPGSQGANYPFWSADSKYIAFFANGKLLKVDASGGPTQALCEVSE